MNHNNICNHNNIYITYSILLDYFVNHTTKKINKIFG
jgi:hypothetical protein